jgi:hypothetical protein
VRYFLVSLLSYNGCLRLLSRLLPTSFNQYRRRDNFISVLYRIMRGSVWRFIARVAMKVIILIHITGYVLLLILHSLSLKSGKEFSYSSG